MLIYFAQISCMWVYWVLESPGFNKKQDNDFVAEAGFCLGGKDI